MNCGCLRMFAALALLTVCSFATAAPAAMITDVTGAASLAETGKARPAALLSYVEPGTSLRLGAGARLVLAFLSSPMEITLTGPAEGTVGSEGVALSRGAISTRSLQAARSDAARTFEPVQRQRLAIATVEMRGVAGPRIVIEGPANTSVYSDAPLLAWRALPGVASYRLVLSDASGTTLIDRSVSATRFTPPQPLAFGASYQWRVEVNLPSGEPVSAQAAFSVIDAGRAKRIAALRPAAQAPFSERVLFAAQLESEGLAYEAKREWRALASERDDPALREWAER